MILPLCGEELVIVILRSGRVIVNGGEPYIVAELNSSHNGKMEVAREMIKEIGRAHV